jgi:hypothetical protein
MESKVLLPAAFCINYEYAELKIGAFGAFEREKLYSSAVFWGFSALLL